MARDAYESLDPAKQYVALLKQLGLTGSDPTKPKLRKHPRFSFDTPEKTILLQVEEFNCALNDVSVGGVSFFSPFNFNIGRQINLNFDGKFSVLVSVVRVLRDDDRSTPQESVHLHGTQFKDSMDGYRCTVLVLQYLLQIMRQSAKP